MELVITPSIKNNSRKNFSILGGDIFGDCGKNISSVNMWLIRNCYRGRTVRISRHNFFKLLFVKLDEVRSLEKKLLARNLVAAACIKIREDQLRRTTRVIRTRVANCVEVQGFSKIYCEL